MVTTRDPRVSPAPSAPQAPAHAGPRGRGGAVGRLSDVRPVGTVAGLPPKFSAMPELPYTAAPCLGEHNTTIFGGLLDLGPEELGRLQAGNVIY